ncbi:MAG: DUF1048 domain-containing protein [Coprobacillus sp.]
MAKSILELLIGDLNEKRAYRQLMKRVNLLPKEYCYAFKKIQNYMYTFGNENCDMQMFTDLLDLFEISVVDNKKVIDIIGDDVAGFCDELIDATSRSTTSREKLNQEILDYFNEGGK